MCRIAGIWKLGDAEASPLVCERMRDTMVRGGPDDAGMYYDRNADLALGHRRLSIIDLSATGRQPMSTDDGRYTICYNGEVYNYRELRKDLESKGCLFKGASDTEVVLNAFVLWGTDCVQRFIGMFSFAVWDSVAQALYLFRDRMGVKPLFYHLHNGVFAFASELKAIASAFPKKLEVSQEALGEFLHYGYISAPRSIFKYTWKLEPATWMKVSRDLDIQKHTYWRPDCVDRCRSESRSTDHILDELEELLTDAFQKRLIADVPVGVFLSGGIDSSLVTAILARHTTSTIKTFTIGFKEKAYDESNWARRVAEHLGTAHTQEIVTPEHVRNLLPEWPRIYDEPFGDISGIPTTIVSRMTRKHVKVSLSADGGDEQFCGYHRYWVMNRLNQRLGRVPKRVVRLGGRLIKGMGSDHVSALARIHPKLKLPALKDRMRKFQAVLENWDGSVVSAYPYAVGYWLPHELERLMGSYEDPRPGINIQGRDVMHAMMDWDMRFYLPDDILTKVDRATMYCSLEGREPFLDHRIVEFAQRLPLHMKYRDGSMKYILKELLKRYLPRELFDRPKQGFAVPIYSWLHDDLVHLVRDYLNPDVIRNQTEIDPEMVAETVSDFYDKGSSIVVDRIWLLLVYMMWREGYG